MAITREDILEMASTHIYLGTSPARAIALAYINAFKIKKNEAREILERLPRSGALPLDLAFTLDVNPEITYTLYYPVAAAKQTMSPYVHGGLIDDLNHRGESPVTVSKYLLAFTRGGEMDRFPRELEDLVDVENLRPLPSRIISRVASPKEEESFDPDLDEEDFLYDDESD